MRTVEKYQGSYFRSKLQFN